jgi:MSHA pilin protein MshC
MAKRRVPAIMPTGRGFTLVELIVTMIIVGILAVAVIPRFANRTDFDSRGFYDGTLSILQYAQKSAVAQRRQVCVTFTAASVTLTIASLFGGACDTNLTGPNGASPYTMPSTPTAGVAFVTPPANFSFLPSGAASPLALAGQTISVTGMPGKLITVDAVTGYVYSN